MPVVLNQHFLPGDRVYEDVEYSLYHYPREYFARIRPYDRFIYYRPLGKAQRRPDSKHYFGYGVFGQVFPDPRRSDHYFVDVTRGEPFGHVVPLLDGQGRYYETETAQVFVAQSLVREISETAYHRILAAAGTSSATLSLMPSTEQLVDFHHRLVAAPAPRDRFREIVTIPAGAGYVPSGEPVDVYESAALQERARADHQVVLGTLQSAILRQGGSTWYNNNVDLFAAVGEKRYLIEAKSLNDMRDSVDRVRYGIGQLADYAYRYANELKGPQKILAFGQRPSRETAWLGDVLNQERTAFLIVRGGVIEPLNEIARTIDFLG